MAIIEFSNVNKSFRGNAALEDVSFDVEADGFTVLCGPPQCGKSVLLRMLVGLETPDSGSVSIDGIDLCNVAPGQRRIGYVPQSFALYPHWSVYKNIAYPLTLHGASRADIRRRVDETAELLGIGHLLDNKPDQISGGEKQRVAVARGLLNDAEIFVLDDPLVGLDFKLRERLMDDLRRMRDQINATFVYATSDALEALAMADALVVLDAGRVIEANDTARLYSEPAHLRSAQIVGFPPCNTIAGEYDANEGVFSAPGLTVPVDADTASGRLTAVLRPEHIRVNPEHDEDGVVHGRGEIRLVEDLGGEYVVYFDAGEQTLTTCVAAFDWDTPPAEGDAMTYSVDPTDVRVYRSDNGAFVGRGRRQTHA